MESPCISPSMAFISHGSFGQRKLYENWAKGDSDELLARMVLSPEIGSKEMLPSGNAICSEKSCLVPLVLVYCPTNFPDWNLPENLPSFPSGISDSDNSILSKESEPTEKIEIGAWSESKE